MVGIDTNILVRYFAQDDEQQSKAATHLMEEALSHEQPGFISSPVLVETFWTLKRSYALPRDIIYTILEKLLTAIELSFEYREEAWKALQISRTTNSDFADALIGMIHKHHGCDITLTFDKKAARLDSFKILE